MVAGTKGEEKEMSRDHILQTSIPDEAFRFSFEGTGEPWQVWGTRRAGTVLCFRKTPLAFQVEGSWERKGQDWGRRPGRMLGQGGHWGVRESWNRVWERKRR